MGSEQSLTKTTSKPIQDRLLTSKTDKSQKSLNNRDNLTKDLSSYKGIKTSFHQSENEGELTKDTSLITLTKKTDKTDKKIKNSDETTKQIKDKDTQSQLVEVTFGWTEGGSEVLITGSFANWKQYFKMEKQGDYFCRKIALPREKHNFKFIVDKIWRISSLYEKKMDENKNINNFIDLTNVFIGNFEEGQVSFTGKETEVKLNSSSTIRKQVQKKDSSSRRNSKSSKSKKSGEFAYTDEITQSKLKLNSQAPNFPCTYVRNFSINNNSTQEKIGKTKFLDLKIKQYNSSNTTTKSIGVPPHTLM